MAAAPFPTRSPARAATKKEYGLLKNVLEERFERYAIVRKNKAAPSKAAAENAAQTASFKE